MCRLGYTERNINEHIHCPAHTLLIYTTYDHHRRMPHHRHPIYHHPLCPQDASVPRVHRARGRPLPAHPQRGGAQLRGTGAGGWPGHRSVLILLPELFRHQ